MAFDNEDRGPFDIPDSDPYEPGSIGGLRIGARLIGESMWDMAGKGVAGAGDIDGDGYGDVLVGAPYESTSDEPDSFDAGAAYVVRGPVYGDLPLTDAWAKVDGENESDRLGEALASIGDTDGDGLPEFVVASQTGGYDSHHLVEIPGEGISPVSDVAAWIHTDTSLSGAVGGGDIDGDGCEDLLVGHTRDEEVAPWAGAVFVWVTPPIGDADITQADAKFTGEMEQEQAGYSVAAAGDIDDDGYADFLVGAPGGGVNCDPGKAYLVRGPVAGTQSLSNADVRFIGLVDSDQTGVIVGGDADMDGDGQEDVLIVAYGSGDAEKVGAAYLFYELPPGEVSLSHSDARLWAGRSSVDEVSYVTHADFVGDLDGDGMDELLVVGGGSLGTKVYLVLDTPAGSIDLSEYEGAVVLEEDYTTSLVTRFAGAGDVDGDGLDDLLLGAPRASIRHERDGVVYLIYGGDQDW